jgi:serine/threonine protein kinase
MSSPSSLRELPTENWQEVKKIASLFEGTWQGNNRPAIEDYLPADPAVRLPVLVQLVRSDLENRLRFGEQARVEDYFARFPMLAQDAELVLFLIAAEYRERQNREAGMGTQEYLARFPQWAAPIFRRLTAPDPSQDAATHPGFGKSSPSSEACTPGFPGAHRGQGAVTVVDDPSLMDLLQRAAQSMPRPGDEFAGFQLLSELGRGAIGRVFLAQQPDLAHRQVVLKISAHLLEEWETLAQLQHTNIVPIYSVHQEGALQAICMPYFGTTTLEDIVTELYCSGRIPQSGKELVRTLRHNKPTVLLSRTKIASRASTVAGAEREADSTQTVRSAPAHQSVDILEKLQHFSYVEAVLWIGDRLAKGLAHAHEHGILHRDLKPANILLTNEGEPMLLDFNLAEDIKQRGNLVALVGGTRSYMSPEQLDSCGGGGAIDARSDIYSLGLILYKMLTGRHPYPTPEWPSGQVLRQKHRLPPAPLRALNRGVSSSTEAIILRCLEVDPARRYQTARELGEDLERQLANQPLKYTREHSLLERVQKWARRHPRLNSATTVAAAFLVLLLAGTWMALNFWKSHRDEFERVSRKQAHTAALEAREQLAEALHYQHALMSSHEPDTPALAAVRDLSARALQVYQVPDNPSWPDLPVVQNLDPAERDMLRQIIGDMLMTWTEAETIRAARAPPGAARQEAMRRAWCLHEGTAACLGEDRVGPEWWRQRGVLLAVEGKEQEARNLFRKAEQMPRRSARDVFLEAARDARQRKYARAIPLLQEATRTDPKLFWAWYTLGICHEELGHREEAVSAFNTCLALAPDPAIAFFPTFGRSGAYLHWGGVHLEQAEVDADKAVALVSSLGPEMRRRVAPQAYLHRAEVRVQRNCYAAAEQDLTRALELGMDIRALSERAKVRELRNDKAGALLDREACLAMKPADEAAWNDRGLAQLPANPRAAPQTGTLQVLQNEMFDFMLAVNNYSWDLLSSVQMTILDANGQPVFTMTSYGGQPPTTAYV